MTNQNKLSRRETIKLLGAAAGAGVLANLPSKWSKPSISSGVLPAFAQTSELTVLAPCGFYNEPPINQLFNACVHVIFQTTATPNMNVNFVLAPVQLSVVTPQPTFGTVPSGPTGAVSLVTEVMLNGQESNPSISNQFKGPGVVCAESTVNFFITDFPI